MRFLPLLAAALPIGGSLAAAVGIQDAGEVPDVNASLDKRYSTSPKCNVAGYSEEHYTPFQVIKQSKCSPQQCSSYCRQKSKCQSFAVGNSECSFYAAPVSRNCMAEDSPCKRTQTNM